MIAASARTDAGNSVALDQFSIAQKSFGFCPFGAPIGARVKDGEATIYQTCCNHWHCPVCSPAMAAKIRLRVVYGATVLSAFERGLFFWTFTCRGRDLSLETSDDDYYGWTNKALNRLRYQARKQEQPWFYVQITERQARGAAHSHFIHTFVPDDGEVFQDARGRFSIVSEQFVEAVMDAGLGSQCQITVIDSPEAVGSYISGYLKKHIHKEIWPAHWHRVRWSKGWPPLPEQAFDYAGVLRTRQEWDKADRQRVEFVAETEFLYRYARHHMVHVQPPTVTG